jgi:hypothetical protein
MADFNSRFADLHRVRQRLSVNHAIIIKEITDANMSFAIDDLNHDDTIAELDFNIAHLVDINISLTSNAKNTVYGTDVDDDVRGLFYHFDTVADNNRKLSIIYNEKLNIIKINSIRRSRHYDACIVRQRNLKTVTDLINSFDVHIDNLVSAFSLTDAEVDWFSS